MNIGSEEGKGTELVLETHDLLVKQPCPGKYVGNVEGRGLYQGDADVIICEGFVGNVVLKVSEGMAEMMMKVISSEVLKSLDTERHQASMAFKALHARFEYHEVGACETDNGMSPPVDDRRRFHFWSPQEFEEFSGRPRD